MKKRKDMKGKREIACLKCKKTFKRNSNLADHMKTHDINRKKVKCPKCECKYYDVKNLKAHLKDEHNDVVSINALVWCNKNDKKITFTCDYCKKVLKRKFNLKLHLKACSMLNSITKVQSPATVESEPSKSILQSKKNKPARKKSRIENLTPKISTNGQNTTESIAKPMPVPASQVFEPNIDRELRISIPHTQSSTSMQKENGSSPVHDDAGHCFLLRNLKKVINYFK